MCRNVEMLSSGAIWQYDSMAVWQCNVGDDRMTHGWCSAGVELAWPRNLDISTIIQAITSPVLCPRPASTWIQIEAGVRCVMVELEMMAGQECRMGASSPGSVLRDQLWCRYSISPATALATLPPSHLSSESCENSPGSRRRVRRCVPLTGVSCPPAPNCLNWTENRG